MSRRKQSNPKPLKRPEEEDDESDVALKTDHSETGKDMETDQSEHDVHSDNEIEPKETNDSHKDSNEPNEEICDKENVDLDTREDNSANKNTVTRDSNGAEMSTTDTEESQRVKFPSDLLTLQQVNDTEYVTSIVEVAKGTMIGPYEGETVALSSIKPGDCVLQFQASDGELSFIKVIEEEGTWLSRLRPAYQEESHNTSVFFEGGKIWCEIVETLRPGTELLASFTTNHNEGSPARDVTGSTKTDTAGGGEVKMAVSGVKKADKSSAGVTPQPALIFGCMFCGVRFSSMRTLDAHLTYYCSKKPADFVSLQDLQRRIQEQAAAQLEHQQKGERDADSPQSNGQSSPKPVKRVNESSSPDNTDSTSDGERPQAKSPKTGETYRCKSCSYVTDRLSSYHRHQAGHAADNESSTDNERQSVSPSTQDENYCKECKIQFSSVRTYRGHKDFYCKYRNTDKKEGSSSSELASPSAVSQSELALKLLSPTMALENQLLATANGQLYPAILAANPTLLHSSLFLQEYLTKAHVQAQQHGEIAKALNQTPLNQNSPSGTVLSSKSSSDIEDQPLDLSKSSKEPSMESSTSANEKSDLTIKVEARSSPEQLSPPAKKVKTDNDNTANGTNLPKTPLNIPTMHPSLLIPGQVQFVNKKPVPPLQSVSRCVECNIVFYKHENFLIHKEHYCSGRRNKDSSSDSDNQDSNDNKSFEMTSANQAANTESTQNPKVENKPKVALPEQKRQTENSTSNEVCLKFFCIPCKIKFSSAGTLKAHKEYYCPHTKGTPQAKDRDRDNRSPGSDAGTDSAYRCENCKNDFTSARLLKLHICMGEVSTTPLLRCLYCDYVTQTENRLSEHMKVHIPTKSFKCNICGYRGNTARGMRMHGKMHIENGEEFTDDNMIEYEEPPLVPIQTNGVCNKGPVNMEAELIRMKNEPYKRRRSRKSFEKSENMVPFLGQVCRACGQTFANPNDFLIHLHLHEKAVLEAMKCLRCEHCNEYVAESFSSMLLHVQTKHPEQLPGTSKTEDDRLSESERSKSCDSQGLNERSRSSSVESSKTNHSSSSRENRAVNYAMSSSNGGIQDNGETPGFVEIKVEKDLSDNESDRNEAPKSQNNNDLPSNLKSQHALIKSPYKSTEELRSNQSEKKSVSSQQSTEQSDYENQKEKNHSPQKSKELPTPFIKGEPRSPMSVTPKDQNPTSKASSISPTLDSKQRDAKLSPKLTSPDPKTRYLMNIKQEQMSPPTSVTPTMKSPPPSSPKTPITSPKLPLLPLGPHSPQLHNIPLLYMQSPHALLTPYQIAAASLQIPLIPGMALSGSPTGQTSPVEHTNHKYCKHCDINFTYLKSFQTHKRYYCSARNADDAESPTATA